MYYKYITNYLKNSKSKRISLFVSKAVLNMFYNISNLGGGLVNLLSQILFDYEMA